MRILIVGAGLSGCSLARLLQDRGHGVSLIEKEDHIGGLCITRIGNYDLKFEPFGGRTFHTSHQRIIDFVTRFDPFNGYTHRKGMIIHDRLFPFPITREAIGDFEEQDAIFKELQARPKVMDKTNFETACLSIFGPTLYQYFVANYTAKMWGTDPRNLTAEWAPKRLEFRQDDREGLFAGQWQGLPDAGYSVFLERMIDGISVELGRTAYAPADWDVVVNSAPIDQVLDYRYGRLQYRSMLFEYEYDQEWERADYGTINLPQDPRWIRKCNFKVLHKQNTGHNIIQYQEPIAADEQNVPMYPINTLENNRVFDQYLKDICGTKNICPIGRLGLFKYLDMDKAVEVAFDMVDVVENYLTFNADQRYSRISHIRQSY